MDSFVGKWKLVQTENFEDLMKAYGVGMVTRKMANAATPVLTVKKHEDGSYEFESITTFKTSKFSFKLDEEFKESCPDGPTVTSLVKVEDGKMVHEQRAEGSRPQTWITRSVENDQMKMIFKVKDLVCTRVYGKLE